MNEEETGSYRPVEAMETDQQSPTQTQGDDSSSENVASSSDDSEEQPVTVGGTIDSDAFALLDGVVYHDMHNTSEFERVSIPLTRLPATLGRTHKTEDQHFFGLGTKKSVSREQCRIFYQDADGGRLIQKGAGDDFTYQTPPKQKRTAMTLQNSKKLPPKGFFAIECVGKNPIFVDKKPVEQGEIVGLESGTPIRISTYCLYFLLPTDVATQKTMTVPNPSFRKRPSSEAAGPPNKRENYSNVLMAELESLSVEELLQETQSAIDSGKWERRHQLMGGVVAVHAVKAAARSKNIRKLAKQGGGVSRSTIMNWIAESPVFQAWVTNVLLKVEFRSYQENIRKALYKAGFTRIGTRGSSVMWQLPKTDSDDDDDDDEEEELEDDIIEGQAAANKQKNSVMAEIESLSVEELLQETQNAFDSGNWERRHQVMGGTIAVHAVKAAARSKRIRNLAKQEGGVSRHALMEWIEDNPMFSNWVKHTLQKVESKSYEENIRRALNKAGFTRTGTGGINIKWQLPKTNSDYDDEDDEEEEQDDDIMEEDAAENEEKSAEESHKGSEEESGAQSTSAGSAPHPTGQNNEEDDDDSSSDSMEEDESPDRANEGAAHQDGGNGNESEQSDDDDDSSVNHESQVTLSAARKENDDDSDDSGSDLIAQS